MSAIAEKTPTLEQDAELGQPLRRVAYEAGMMLGLEASREEQEYHRRRLTRHQYWLHGFGTLAGMLVSLSHESVFDSTDNITVRIIVGEGAGIDGLGREVLIHEPYCMNLSDWLASRTETELREGYIDAEDILWLKVTVRHKDCAVAAQPVLARKLNLSTDAVQPSRTADSVMLDLKAELPSPVDTRFQPWAKHQAIDNAMPGDLTSDEAAVIAAAEADAAVSDAAVEQLRLHAKMLYALNEAGVNAQTIVDELASEAGLLLAHIAIDVTDINDILVNPSLIRVNNLVRPFLTTASQLAYLARQA